MLGGLLDGAAEEFFVKLGEFAADGYLAFRAEVFGKLGKGFKEAVRRFVEDDSVTFFC